MSTSIPNTNASASDDRSISSDVSGLALTLKEGEKLFVGENIVLVIVQMRGSQARIVISAPKDVRILREKVKNKIEQGE